ncbi:LacI family transcriptional regulator [Neolewinella aurantiaca]|uniref:LacI family transcriptional regulator n=1 Tax=Neolewinella aurantiaca TaxID=2602767 RepID=A0A5C7G0Y5_9BACT|nr:LacI family DNA-binding transcriptional regulator [Neolewinella aurantiaca]TXF91419.1 LacI family transcriptional regulator [Neolewinella aurantiaca]
MAKKTGKTTIHDIAFALGLNASTVSRALANNPVVSKKTRDLVQEKATELNYQPNHIAAALRRGRSDILGVIVPAIDRAFFSSVIRGIEEKADEEGYHIMVCQSYDSSEREQIMVKTLRRVQVDGVLISLAKDGKTDKDFYRKLIEGGLPIQFFDNIPEDIGAPAVVIDDEKGAYEATKHLISKGYRRIAHLNGPRYLHIYRDRYKGYLRALTEAGLPVNDDYVVQIENHFDSGEEAFHKLWQLPERPDAIFAASDFSAAGGVRAAQSLGLRVPQDIAFIGFANEPFTEIITPKISTVDQQTLEMGRRSAERLMAALNDDSSAIDADPKLVLSPRVIVRGSSE